MNHLNTRLKSQPGSGSASTLSLSPSTSFIAGTRIAIGLNRAISDSFDMSMTKGSPPAADSYPMIQLIPGLSLEFNGTMQKNTAIG